jgi:hypothetical protein
MTEPMHVERTPTRPLVIVAILGAVFFAWIVWRVNTGNREPTGTVLECKARYAGARSFTDTARIDMTYPTDYARERRGRVPASCGDLRREQLLP